MKFEEIDFGKCKLEDIDGHPVTLTREHENQSVLCLAVCDRVLIKRSPFSKKWTWFASWDAIGDNRILVLAEHVDWFIENELKKPSPVAADTPEVVEQPRHVVIDFSALKLDPINGRAVSVHVGPGGSTWLNIAGVDTIALDVMDKKWKMHNSPVAMDRYEIQEAFDRAEQVSRFIKEQTENRVPYRAWRFEVPRWLHDATDSLQMLVIYCVNGKPSPRLNIAEGQWIILNETTKQLIMLTNNAFEHEGWRARCTIEHALPVPVHAPSPVDPPRTEALRATMATPPANPVGTLVYARVGVDEGDRFYAYKLQNMADGLVPLDSPAWFRESRDKSWWMIIGGSVDVRPSGFGNLRPNVRIGVGDWVVWSLAHKHIHSAWPNEGFYSHFRVVEEEPVDGPFTHRLRAVVSGQKFRVFKRPQSLDRMFIPSWVQRSRENPNDQHRIWEKAFDYLIQDERGVITTRTAAEIESMFEPIGAQDAEV